MQHNFLQLIYQITHLQMINLKYILRFLQRHKKVFILLAITNVILTITFFKFWNTEQSFIASVRIVFNEVKVNFQENQSKSYLFSREKPFEFINLLESDELLDSVVMNFDYATACEIPKENKTRNKIARQILRRKTKVVLETNKLEVSFVDQDRERAEAILLAMINSVESINQNRIKDNNKITKQIAKEYLNDFDMSIKFVKDEMSKFVNASDTLIARNYIDNINEFYAKSMSQKLDIMNTINEIDRLETLPKYKPYFIINNGVISQDIKLLTIIILATFANIIALIFEFQILFVAQYLKDMFAQLKNEASE